MINRRELFSGSLALRQNRRQTALNVLLILVDDWGATDLGCGGSKFLRDAEYRSSRRVRDAIHTSILGLHGLLAFPGGHSHRQVSRARLHLTDWIAGS